jgi:hypothetical protein
MEADLSSAEHHVNGKASVWVADQTYDDESHKDDVPPYGRHDVMKGERELLERGIIVFGAQQSGHCALATVLRKSPADVIQRCTLQQMRSFRDTSIRRYVVRCEGSWTPSRGRQPHLMICALIAFGASWWVLLIPTAPVRGNHLVKGQQGERRPLWISHLAELNISLHVSLRVV